MTHLDPDDRSFDDALAALDPAAGATAPVPGSTRFDSILEHAMRTDATDATHADPDTGAPADADPTVTDPAQADPMLGQPVDAVGSPRRRSRRRLGLVLAAAAAVLAIVAVVVAGPGSDPEPASATEALTRAADGTADATTMRVAATYERAGSVNRIAAEADGADYRIESRATFDDPAQPPEEETTVVIGDTVWEDGTSRTAPPEERNAAYAPSSAAVVGAILDGSELEDRGEQDVRGTPTRHIRATLTDRARAALAALSPSQVAMFELEYPQGVDQIDLWVTDDLIRRIRVVVDQGQGADGRPQQDVADIEFYDFGADITITPPS